MMVVRNYATNLYMGVTGGLVDHFFTDPTCTSHENHVEQVSN